MLIPFPKLVADYSIHPTGVFHLGANECQEIEAYYSNGVQRSVWIDAYPAIYPAMIDACKKYPNALPILECIGSADGKPVDFKISSNNGESSSVLEFGTHSKVHSDVTFIGHIPLVTKTMRTICKERNIDETAYDFLNIDLQGYELEALTGMSYKMLGRFDYAYIEVNKDELYKGCPLVDEIDAFMNLHGFVPVATEWAGDAGWGDRLYKKIYGAS